MTPDLDVITPGESMALLVASTDGPLAEVVHFERRLAGAETNVAIGLARLGLRVAWVSRVGTDAFGRYVKAAVAAEGVDCHAVAEDPGRSTGLMLKGRRGDGGDPAIDYYRRHSAASALSAADLDPGLLLRARHLHVTGILPALSPSTLALTEQAMRCMREAGRTVSFDPNLRPRLWPSRDVMAQTLNRLAALADWVLPGEAEARALTGLERTADLAAFYLDRGARVVFVKQGERGAAVHTAEAAWQLAGHPVPRVVDTVGAGDAFAVGVISAMLEGRSPPEAAARGNWIGARQVQVVGDYEGMPRRGELPAGL